MAGIIQEQHPDRCRLFMQWKQMGWPILVDSLNLLEVTAVPITLALDEYGIVRSERLRVDAAISLEETFLGKTFEAPQGGESRGTAALQRPDLEQLKTGDIAEYAKALFLWGGDDRLDETVAAFQNAAEANPEHGPTQFRLGVALRRRYDSELRKPGDFQNAVARWKTALDIDPNQYIWRRRIQQYGPRLDKPYPFYDWVPQARQEITARGETPSPLLVEPGGAEFAGKTENFETASAPSQEPDPKGRIHRDDRFVEVETTVVPPKVKPGEAVRVHIVYRPNESIKAHWNNEADGLNVWVNPPNGWKLDQRSLSVPNPAGAVSTEIRRIEFEAQCPKDASGDVTLAAYALYYVCEDVNGTCLYRRRDIEVPIALDRGTE
jgi:tetratricopeptide (TPR) repeat protein